MKTMLPLSHIQTYFDSDGQAANQITVGIEALEKELILLKLLLLRLFWLDSLSLDTDDLLGFGYNLLLLLLLLLLHYLFLLLL